MFSSFIAQSCIALIALIALLGLELWNPITKSSEKSAGKSHSNRLIIGLVEFHKAQCYFSSVIQITALSLFHSSRQSVKSSAYSSGHYQDDFDTSVLIVLASSGLIPISLVIACIARYGRQSWYLLILSWISTILASTTLIASYYWAHHYAKAYGDYDNNLGYTFDTSNMYDAEFSCDLDGVYLGDAVSPLCGNSNLFNNSLPSGVVANWWTWLVWVNCIVWLLFCTGRKCYDSERFLLYRERLRSLSGQRFFARWIAEEGKKHRTWILISILPWSLCFASQFYLFSAYFQHSVISPEWSFGQIIAVFVWVPSVVEYLYVEFSKYSNALSSPSSNLSNQTALRKPRIISIRLL